MQGGVAGLKRKASQMSGGSLGGSLGLAISRGSAASAASADSKVILTPLRGFSHCLRVDGLDPVLMSQSDQSAW